MTNKSKFDLRRMKAAILAGGAGTRLSEMTDRVPKPMVEVGGRPILWHIMKTYASYGIKEFVIALGYKGDVIKDYFRRYRHHKSSMVVHLRSGDITLHDSQCEDWTVHLLDTGEGTLTGGRLRRVMEYVGNEPILATSLPILITRPVLRTRQSGSRPWSRSSGAFTKNSRCCR